MTITDGCNSGADIVVCDEAHKLKSCNEKRPPKIVEAMDGIATKRRIALTGTPLQVCLLSLPFLTYHVDLL